LCHYDEGIILGQEAAVKEVLVGKRATPVEVSERQQRLVQRLAQAGTTGQELAIRARIVLMSATGIKRLDQAMAVRVHPERVSRWRVRWARAHERLAAAEGKGASDKDLEALVIEVLSDRARPGAPTTFTPEQVTDIIALACEKPSDSGLPVSHWTPPEVAREAIKRGIVESISARQVDRFLKRSRNQTAQEPILADLAG
jgi:hypothetical protein